jgi:hypothetical protein
MACEAKIANGQWMEAVASPGMSVDASPPAMAAWLPSSPQTAIWTAKVPPSAATAGM